MESSIVTDHDSLISLKGHSSILALNIGHLNFVSKFVNPKNYSWLYIHWKQLELYVNSDHMVFKVKYFSAMNLLIFMFQQQVLSSDYVSTLGNHLCVKSQK